MYLTRYESIGPLWFPREDEYNLDEVCTDKDDDKTTFVRIE